MLWSQAQGNSKYSGGKQSASNVNYSGNMYQNNPSVNTMRMPASKAVISNPNLIDISISGLMNIKADDYVAVFNVVQVGTDITETDDLLNARLIIFKENLKSIGLDSSEVTVDMISFVPRYAIEVENKLFSKNNNEVPAGFELQKNVMIHFSDSKLLDGIVSAAALAEIYDLVKVDYSIKDIEKSYDQLMNACIEELKERVKMYESLGFRLDTVRKAVADNFSTVFPTERYFNYQAFCRPSIPTTKRGVPVRLNEADKTVSRYYNQIEADGYDIVINPVIREPMVQLSYSIQVQYYINEPKAAPAAKNNYYILLEDGNLKQLFPGK